MAADYVAAYEAAIAAAGWAPRRRSVRTSSIRRTSPVATTVTTAAPTRVSEGLGGRSSD